MKTDEEIEKLLGRSLDDDQGNRSYQLERAKRASLAGPAGLHRPTLEESAAVSVPKPSSTTGSSGIQTLRQRLLGLSPAARAKALDGFSADASVSCAYERIDLDAAQVRSKLREP